MRTMVGEANAAPHSPGGLISDLEFEASRRLRVEDGVDGSLRIRGWAGVYGRL